MTVPCRFGVNAWNERYCLTHYRFRASDVCSDGLAALTAKVEEQARVMARLRAALEEGVQRHYDLDRWTREQVETDRGSYIHAIRRALSPTEPKEDVT